MLPALQRELADALIAQGLFPDEAAAMLATWKLSYFESPGLRVFFLLPQAWTDARLPLSVSTPAQVTRVMVGRIELVTERQRETLAKLQAVPLDSFPRLPLYYHDIRVLKDAGLGERSLSQLHEFAGREVPESLRLYERYHVPASGAIFWSSALANIHPGKDDNWVDYHNENRAPLLFISGSDDHLMPPSIQRSNAKHYKAPGLVTEVKEFTGPHLLPSWPGWEEVADYALDWALANARPPRRTSHVASRFMSGPRAARRAPRTRPAP